MCTFNFSITFLVLFMLIYKIDAKCTGLSSIIPFFEKFLPTLVADKRICGPGFGKKMFTDCMMILLEGDAKLCDTTEFRSTEYPNCSIAINKESLTKLSTDGKIKKFWEKFNDYLDDSVEKFDNIINYDQICPKVTSYLLHRFEAFGGETKNPSAWNRYCNEKKNLCEYIDQLDSVKFFKDHIASISTNLLNKINQNHSESIDTIALEIASTFYSAFIYDNKDTEYLDLRYCLNDLFNVIDKKLN